MDNTVKESTTVTQDAMGNTVKRTVRSNYNVFSGDFFVSKVNQVIFTLVTIINVLILFRFVLLLLGANQTGFVSFMISLTNFFVVPFQGIFPVTNVEGGYLELASVMAILVWYLIAWIFAVVIGLFSSKTEDVV
ncbi:MAG: hypothetical protein ABI721_01190 [Candidatus Dojkabacteria bacterium]